jgi:hypothetical protein
LELASKYLLSGERAISRNVMMLVAKLKAVNWTGKSRRKREQTMLRPEPEQTIPEETIRVAHAAFRKGNV